MPCSKLWLDLETYSETPIKHGTYRYAEDADIMLWLYAFDDGEPKCWDLTDPNDGPENHAEMLMELEYGNSELYAANSMFDRSVLRYNGYPTPINRWRDTMVQALCHALPGALGTLGSVLGIAEDLAKKKDGNALIHLFCKPRPKNMKLRRATRETHPEEWQQFIEYGLNDITAMREVEKKLPRYNYPDKAYSELENWHLDQVINDRGFCVDLELVHAAVNAVKLEKEVLRKQTVEMTNGEVTSTTRRDQVLEHLLVNYGVVLGDLKKGTLDKYLNDPSMPQGVRELLAIRLQATTSSTAKYIALCKAVNDDGRCRGTIQFAGASRTLRAAGRTFQPQNLPSRGLLEGYEIAFGIEALKAGEANVFYPNIMRLLSSCVRGALVASPGKLLTVADLANIEGRFAAWASGEYWKIQAFLDYDAGVGPDLYNLAYSRAFRIPVEEVSKTQRAIGKVMELMLQYQGNVGAFVTGALSYGFDLEDLAEKNWDSFPDEELKEATSFYGFVLKMDMPTFGLSKEAYIACNVLVRLWRNSNPQITRMWTLLEEQIRKAITNPKEVFRVGEHLSVIRDTNWLRVILPSGRSLCYANPQIDLKGKISFKGAHPFNRKWERLNAYGGLIMENICQAGSRDILYGAMPRAEAAGFEIVLHVHDELVTESDIKKELTLDNLCEIMSSPVPWAPGLPLAAAGFQDNRYRK